MRVGNVGDGVRHLMWPWVRTPPSGPVRLLPEVCRTSIAKNHRARRPVPDCRVGSPTFVVNGRDHGGTRSAEATAGPTAWWTPSVGGWGAGASASPIAELDEDEPGIHRD